MDQEDKLFTKDPEETLAESLDKSIKDITGIKENSVVITSKSSSSINSTSNEVTVVNKKVEILNKNDSSVGKELISQNLPKISGQIKLPAKQISGTITKDRITGQYVLIQQGGPAVPVRLASSSATSTKQLAVQVIRKSDGTLLPFKSNKQINLGNVTLAGKKIISASGQTVLLNKSAPSTGSTNTPTTTQIKPQIPTVPSTIAQDVPKPPIMKTITISGDKAKYLSSASTKFIKLSPSTSATGSTGNVQTLQLTNKSGAPVQYVRVLNAGVNKESLTPTKVFVKNQDGQIRMVTNTNQQPILDGKKIIIKDTGGKIIQEKNLQQKFTTVPMLRKINESALVTSANKVITVRKDELELLNKSKPREVVSSLSSQSLGTVQKPRILNNLGRLTSNLSVSSNSSNINVEQTQLINKKEHIINKTLMSSNKFSIHNIKISPKKSINFGGGNSVVLKPSTELQQKLYSVLKPNANNIETSQALSNSGLPRAMTKLPVHPSLPVQRIRSPSPPNTDSTLRRKHCNCTKSQCLKLYCDCFASGEFCQDCNCKECYNNLEYEDERQKAIKMCLERNPAAFKPKITKARDQNDLRLHNKGCNCKRSGCLKNYCECYEAKIACSANCKCMGCRNIEDRTGINLTEKYPKNFNRGLALKRPYDEISSNIHLRNSNPLTIANNFLTRSANISSSLKEVSYDSDVKSLPTSNENFNCLPAKQAYNFITPEVVDATIQCMIAQADECQKSGISPKTTERMILEELGRCLVEIIDFSIKNVDN